MIHAITGTVHSIEEHALRISAGPYVFEALCPTAQECSIGQAIQMFAYMHWLQDAGPSLFVFADMQQKIIFQLVLGCQGVGPRTAIAIVAQLGVPPFVQAVLAHDATAISQVPGIGPKRAQQLLLHIASKVEKLVQSGHLSSKSNNETNFVTITAALASLGYTQVEISRTLSCMRAQGDFEMNFQAQMKRALALLGQKRA